MSDSGDRRSFLCSILGDGKVADLMLWKNQTESAAMAAGITGVWLAVGVLDYHFVSLVCHLFIFLMFFLLFWKKLTFFPNSWSPPNAHDLQISEATFTHLSQTLNWLLHNFYEISSGDDIKLFAMVMGNLWLLSVIGEFVNSFNLMYIVFVSLQVVPVVYEKHEEEFKNVASKIKSNMDFYSHIFLSKIPRWHKVKQF